MQIKLDLLPPRFPPIENLQRPIRRTSPDYETTVIERTRRSPLREREALPVHREL